jgi:hypothetical protein
MRSGDGDGDGEGDGPWQTDPGRLGAWKSSTVYGLDSECTRRRGQW